MLVNTPKGRVEVNPEPVATYPDYKVYETSRDYSVHLDNNNRVIVYTSYLGYQFFTHHEMNGCVKDLGDRIEVEKYVGGIYSWYRYHICKTTRQPIAYFESTVDLEEGQVDISQYRIWSSEDIDDYLIIQGLYGNKTQLFCKSKRSAVEFTTPEGEKVTKFDSIKQKGSRLRVRIGWWKRHTADLNTRKLH